MTELKHQKSYQAKQVEEIGLKFKSHEFNEAAANVWTAVLLSFFIVSWSYRRNNFSIYPRQNRLSAMFHKNMIKYPRIKEIKLLGFVLSCCLVNAFVQGMY